MHEPAIDLHLRDIHFQFPDEPEPVFDHLNLRLNSSGVIWIKGASGSGKSTLLKLLAGLIEPTQGQYLFNGQAVDEMSFEDFLPHRLRIGYAFDNGGLLNNRTIQQNLMLPLVYHNICSLEQAQARVSNLMREFQLETVAHLRPSAISGGRRKAACIARSFILKPRILLLDDPDTGLGEELKSSLREKLSRQIDEDLVQLALVSSSDSHFMAEFANQVAFIQQGQISLHGLQETVPVIEKKVSGA